MDGLQRWRICAFLFCATVISYIDRQTIAIAAPVIASEFGLNNEQIARILSAFLFAYTFAQLPAGRFFDWVGSRTGFAISVAIWSLSNTLTAWVSRAWQFETLRFFLGVGESGNFPGGVKVVTEWFPFRDRAFAGGLFASGGSVGAIIAGPLVGTVVHYWGWRAAFLLTGSLGFIWVAMWLLFYRAPREPVESEAGEQTGTELDWLDLFRFSQVWALLLARFLEEPIIWLSLFWLPKYFVDIRHVSVVHTGWLLTAPFVTLDIGYMSGGWLSRLLIREGWSIAPAKFTIMGCAALFMLGATAAGFTTSVAGFTVAISLATMGHGAWFSNVMSLPADFAPPSRVATVYGISSVGGGISGILATEITGVVADRFHSFTPVFVGAGLLPVLGTALMVGMLGKMRRLPVRVG